MFCKSKLKKKFTKHYCSLNFFGNWGKINSKKEKIPEETSKKSQYPIVCVIGETASLPLGSLSQSHCRNDSEGWLQRTTNIKNRPLFSEMSAGLGFSLNFFFCLRDLNCGAEVLEALSVNQTSKCMALFYLSLHLTYHR